MGHMHFIGASGRGKSKILEVIIRQLILLANVQRKCVIVIDPHRELTHALLAFLADYGLDRYVRVRLLDPSDPSSSFGFNPFVSGRHFEPVSLAQEIATGILTAFGERNPYDKPRTMTGLTQVCYALAYHRLSLLEAEEFFYFDDLHGLRAHLVGGLPEQAQRYWAQRERAGVGRWDEYFEAVATRLLPILQTPALRRIFGQTGNVLDMAEAMDAGEIILVNLKPGEHLSSEASRLLGTLLVREIYVAAHRRKNYSLNVGRENAVPTYVFVDEAQLYMSHDFGRILDQLRKWDVYIGISHQHLSHLSEQDKQLAASVATNCPIRAVFGGLEPTDCEYLARLVFRGTFDAERPKLGFRQPVVVGVRRTTMANASQSSGSSHAVGETTGTSGSTAENASTTRSNSTTQSASTTRSSSNTHSSSVADSTSETEHSGWSTSDTDGTSGGTSFSYDDTPIFPRVTGRTESEGRSGSSSEGRSGGQSTTTGRTVTEGTAWTDGTAETEGIATTEGDAVTKGTSRTAGWNRSGTVTSGTNQQASRGVSEAFEPIYEMRATQLWSLDEQVRMRADELGRLPRGHLYLQIGTKWPRRIAAAYLEEKYVAPDLIELVRSSVLEQTPWVKTAAEADAGYRMYRERLLASASPPALQEADGFDQIAAKIKGRRKGKGGDA